jgi:hypothetical protein
VGGVLWGAVGIQAKGGWRWSGWRHRWGHEAELSGEFWCRSGGEGCSVGRGREQWWAPERRPRMCCLLVF